MNIFLIQAARQKMLISLVSAIGIFFLNPAIQSVNTSLAFQIWFLDIVQKPLSSIPYFVFSILFGMFMSLYFFAKTSSSCIDCKTNAKSGIGGTALGFVIGVCPACFSFIGFLLPLSGSLFLSSYSPLFIMVSIGIILFSIHRMGGFKVVSVVKSQN